MPKSKSWLEQVLEGAREVVESWPEGMRIYRRSELRKFKAGEQARSSEEIQDTNWLKDVFKDAREVVNNWPEGMRSYRIRSKEYES